jgi:hypothetical protein
MNEQVKAMVEKLIERSNKNEVAWEREGVGSFRVVLSNGSVETGSIGGTTSNPIYTVKILSRCGLDVYERASNTNESRDHYKLLKELYVAAGMAYHENKNMVMYMLNEIKNSDIVGKRDENQTIEN